MTKHRVCVICDEEAKAQVWWPPMKIKRTWLCPHHAALWQVWGDFVAEMTGWQPS
jgi:hypothetical protein